MDITRLSDDELWNRTKAIARAERASACDLVEHLAEIDRRNLPGKRMRISLYDFCVHQLRLSEDAAYRRIRAARAIRRFPPITLLLRDGRLSIETVSLLHPFLNDPDTAALVKRCIGLRKWQVQALLAGRQPETARRDVIRFCGPAPTAPAEPPQEESPLLAWTAPPAPAGAPTKTDDPPSTPSPLAAPSKAAAVRAPAIRVSFTADADFHKLLLRARAILRHKYPDGRLEGVLKDALVALLKRKDPGIRWAPAKGALARR